MATTTAHMTPDSSLRSFAERERDRKKLQQLERLIAAGLVSSQAYKRPTPLVRSKTTHHPNINRALATSRSASASRLPRSPSPGRSSSPSLQSRPELVTRFVSGAAGTGSTPCRRSQSASNIPSRRRFGGHNYHQSEPLSSHPGRSASFATRVPLNMMPESKSFRDRHERTFVGTQCAACEEPLEHTLRGERILQLSCGHVSHEACFYEYIKEFNAQYCPTCDAPLGIDTNRGANIDFENLHKLVRSAQTSTLDDGYRSPVPPQSPSPSANTWVPHHSVRPSLEGTSRPSRDHLLPSSARSPTNGFHGHQVPHQRTHSSGESKVSSGEYQETAHTNGRRHDYDVQSMETSLRSPKMAAHAARNPIPPPSVTIRSEFPTLSKSRQQQNLTCLVTVEVVDGKWQPHAADIRSPPPMPVLPTRAGAQPTTPPASDTTKAKRRSFVHRHQVEDPVLEDVRNELYRRVDNWHGLDFDRFGKLVLHGMVRVGKDRHVWQVLECYLFTEMLICVKEKRNMPGTAHTDDTEDFVPRTRCTLKGSILIKKHLDQVEVDSTSHTLTLSLSVAELPQFHLQFLERSQMETWREAFDGVIAGPLSPEITSEQELSGEEDEYVVSHSGGDKRSSSIPSSANQSQVTAPTEYTNSRIGATEFRMTASPAHVPVDLVVVVPVSSSMQGLKIGLLRDALRFMVSNLGEQDRMGLVTFGSGGGGVPLVGMTNKHWDGWSKVFDSIRPAAHKTMRADVIEGANVAMDLLMSRRSSNPLASILLISDAANTDTESVDFVVSRAEAAKITIHSFGLGLTHRPDTLVEISTRTKASYTYVKDWMMLRECMAGALGSLQSISHQNVKLKLRLPEGSPARFVKISGALQTTRRTAGRDAEAALGDLRFGDKRDILVQLSIAPEGSTIDGPSDAWETVVAGLEALSGGSDHEDAADVVEEVPLIQSDLIWGDLLREGSISQLPRPSLLAITMLPSPKRLGRSSNPVIPPHPSVVQRRMELLTCDMLSRALTLSSKGMSDRASHLLSETRLILKGLGKGGLPPLPTPPPTAALPPPPSLPTTPRVDEGHASPIDSAHNVPLPMTRTPTPPHREAMCSTPSAAGIDPTTMTALDTELTSSLEYIVHPTVFGRDSRKAMLQAIGIINSQRAYNFRTPLETLWALRAPGVRRLTDCSREWRDYGEDTLREEA